MKSSRSGTATSALEVTNISQHGFWLFHEDREYFLPYDEYPWFREATVAMICRVEDHGGGHFYWPDLDVDLSIEILRRPQQFPLLTRTVAVSGRPSSRPIHPSRQRKPSGKGR